MEEEVKGARDRTDRMCVSTHGMARCGTGCAHVPLQNLTRPPTCNGWGQDWGNKVAILHPRRVTASPWQVATSSASSC